MQRFLAGLLAIHALGLACAAAAGPDADDAPAWQADARKAGLSPQAIVQLQRNKLVIAGPTFKQVFESYTQPVPGDGRSMLPHFVTSDATLHAFHVLFEESVSRLERMNAVRLRDGIADSWKHLATVDAEIHATPQIVHAAKQRAQIVIGTALRLTGGEPEGADATTRTLIDAELKKVMGATEIANPTWLGGGEKATRIDYTRCKPRGFYTRSESLSAYFRATAWLQAVPFNCDDDASLLAALMIASGIREPDEHRGGDAPDPRSTQFGEISDSLEDLLGSPAEPDLLKIALIVKARPSLDLEKPQKWAALREETRKVALAPPRNRHSFMGGLLQPQEESQPPSTRPVEPLKLRVLAARLIPDSAMFQATTHSPEIGDRAFPDGLEVCVALGNDYAATLGKGAQWEAVVQLLQQKWHHLAPEEHNLSDTSLYRHYLYVLVSLQEPEKDAPAFMKSDAWKRKQCQTTLAGWAQLRHTWVLQAQQSAALFGGPARESGFVEPSPEFFSRLYDFAIRSEAMLDKFGALGCDCDAAAEALRASIDALTQAHLDRKGGAGWRRLPDEEKSHVMYYGELVDRKKPDMDNAAWSKLALELLGEWKKELKRLERAEQPSRAIREVFSPDSTDLHEAWDRFANTCRTLEILSHKELRGVTFNERENKFIEGFGETLAQIMLYQGDAYISPRDDAPRIADVHTELLSHRMLEVGIGRPRAIYVLYPWQGEEVLCRGAVLPYYEFATADRLSDDQWKQLLDSPQCPSPAQWALPLYCGKPTDHE